MPPAPVQTQPSRRTFPAKRCALWLLALLVAALALAVRVPGLTESLWYDEALRTGVVLGRNQGWRLVLYDVHNPLYNVFMTGWIRLFGDSEVAIRIPTVVAGAAAVLIAAAWAARRFGAAVAWLFAVWAMLAPAHVWYSTEAKNNLFSVLMGALVLVSHARLLEGRPRRDPADPSRTPGTFAGVVAGMRGRIALAVIAAALGVLTDFAVLLVIVPVWIAHAVNLWRSIPPGEAHDFPTPEAEAARRREGWILLSAAVVCTLVLVAPFIIFKATHADGMLRTYLRHFSLRQLFLLVCNFLVNGNTIFPEEDARSIFAGLTAPLTLGALVLGWFRMDRTRDGRVVNAAFILPILFYLAVSHAIAALVGGSRHWIYQDRNLLILLIPFGLILWRGVMALPRPWMRASLAAFFIGLNITGSVLMSTVYAGQRTVMAAAPDWRQVGQIIEAQGRDAGAAPFVITRSWTEPLRYYAPSAEFMRLRGERPYLRRARDAAAAGRPLLAVHDEAWMEMTETDWRRLRARFELEPLAEVGKIRIVRLHPKPRQP